MSQVRAPAVHGAGIVVRRATLWIGFSLAACSTVEAQEPVRDTIAEARRFHDEPNLSRVEALLVPYLRDHPDNGDAARLLAQTLYWLKRPAEARAIYERALVLHPDDATLRLDYGRMLLEMNDRGRLREVLAPLSGTPRSGGRAEVMMGTIEYWNGDFTTATRLFRDALRADSGQTDARRQLGEILMLTAPWSQATAEFRRDDQPLTRLAGDVQAGWYATPLLALSARVRPMQFFMGDAVTRTLTSVEVLLSGYAPAVRLKTELAAGALQRSFGASSDWTGRVVLGFRLPNDLTLRVRAEREPYLYTRSSLSMPVMTHTFATTLDLDTPGRWLAQAAAASERYPDGNAVSTGYAWVLAPLINAPNRELQVGYSIAAQHANESRFVLARPNQPFPPGDPRFSTLGVYAPYYTPSRLLAQSVLVAMASRRANGVELRASGAYGVRATDDAPTFEVITAGAPPVATVQQTFVRRAFTPWNIRGAVAAPLAEGWRLDVSGEYGRTAFYASAMASVQLTYRFVAAARRKAAQF